MRELQRQIVAKIWARNTQKPSYRMEDCGSKVEQLPVKVVSVLDLTEDVHRSGIKRGMHVLELGCGVGDLSLWIAKLVGPTGLVVGADESSEDIDAAQKRATVAGQCYWTRFVTADLNTFNPHERFDIVVVHRALSLERERATFLRLSSWVHPDGVIMIMVGKPAGGTDNRSFRSHAFHYPSTCYARLTRSRFHE